MCRFIERLRHWAPAFAGATWLAVVPAQAGTQFPGVGRPATPDEIAAWDIDVRPDFKGLPKGSGSVAKGQEIWDAKCASCHGTFGESNEVFTPLVGGTKPEDMQAGRAKALVTGGEARTTLMKLATISTLWDYIRRAMPWNAPKSLSPDEVYAVTAYLLNLGDIVPAGYVLSDANIGEAQQRLPNRNGMSRAHGLGDIRGTPDVKNVACMKDCPTEARVTSSLPDYARGSHGDLAEQTRAVGAASAKAAPMPAADLARRKACLACHGVEKALVGPAFKDIAARYKGQAGAEGKLVEKVKQGGSGVWGQLPMPPHPDLSASDAAALVRWILDGSL